jgi:hypothetical protein
MTSAFIIKMWSWLGSKGIWMETSAKRVTIGKDHLGLAKSIGAGYKKVMKSKFEHRNGKS